MTDQINITSIMGLIGSLLDLLRKKPKFRNRLLLISLIVIITDIGILLAYSFFYDSLENSSSTKQMLVGILIVFSVYFVFSVLSFLPINFTKTSVEFDLNELKEERKAYQEKMTKTSGSEIFTIINLNLNQLTEYYTINKSQAKNSFRLSLFAIIIGLITLITGIWIFYFNSTTNITLTIISSLSSILIEFIGVAYFWVYKKSLVQLNFLYAELVKTQKQMMAIELMKTIKDPKEQLEMRKIIIHKLINYEINLSKIVKS